MAAKNRFALRKQAAKLSRYFDYNLIVIVFFLLAFGLVMIYSTSSYDAYLTFGKAGYYLKRQIFATIAGIVFMIVIALIPYHFWERVAGMAYVVALVFIFMIIPFGYEANGARRWIRIMGISMQPAEVAKICMIIFLACMISRMGRNVNSGRGILYLFISTCIVSGLLLVITSNLSSAIIVFAIAFMMVFVSSPGYKRYVLFVIGVLIAAAIAVAVIVAGSRNSGTDIGGFRGSRILAWLDPEAYASGKGFQTLQALYAIGSGGIMGKGLGESVQKLGFLPEAQNDMIFSIICEELGIFGAAAVIILFILLIWRLKLIADGAPDLFGALLVVGVLSHIAVQVILNIAVVTNTIPNTGISLPFISYGGSASFFLLGEIGLCLSVARGIRVKDY